MLDHVAKKVNSELNIDSVEGYTEAMLSLRNYLLTGNVKNNVEEIVFNRIRKSKTQRDIIESLIIANCPLEEYEVHLGIPREAITLYKELYCDTSIFLTKLDYISYIENYKDERGKVIRERAFDVGYHYILGVYAGVLPSLEQSKEYIAKMFFATTSKALSLNYASSSSNTAKHAKEYTKLMTELYGLVSNSNTESIHINNDITIQEEEIPYYMKRNTTEPAENII